MNAKFESDDYGLKLKLTASNDSERVLLNELLRKGVLGHKEKNLIVQSAELNSLDVYRPVYLSKSIFRKYGFSGNMSGNSDRIVCFKLTGGYTLIFAGSGIYEVYIFQIDWDNALVPVNKYVQIRTNEGHIEFVLLDGTVGLTCPIASALLTYRKIATLRQLDEILSNY